MEERKFSVYIHINKINNKKYVGITSRNPNERWRNNGSEYKGQPFYNAILKYGFDNFEHLILHSELTEEEAKQYEIYYIEKYNTYIDNPNSMGYNTTLGGEVSVYGGNNPMARKIIFKDKIYDTVLECAEDLGFYPSTIVNWIKGERAIPIQYAKGGLRYLYEEPNYIIKKNEKMNGGKHKKVECNGVIYDNIQQCAECYNIKANTITKWLNGINGMPNNFFKMNLHYIDDELSLPKKREYANSNPCYLLEDDLIFDSRAECSRYLKDKYNVKDGGSSAIARAILKKHLYHGFTILDYSDYLQKTKEELDLMRNSLKEYPHAVSVVNLNEKIWFSKIADAALYYNGHASNLTVVLNGEYKRFKGYEWVRLEEYKGDISSLRYVSHAEYIENNNK